MTCALCVASAFSLDNPEVVSLTIFSFVVSFVLAFPKRQANCTMTCMCATGCVRVLLAGAVRLPNFVAQDHGLRARPLEYACEATSLAAHVRLVTIQLQAPLLFGCGSSTRRRSCEAEANSVANAQFSSGFQSAKARNHASCFVLASRRMAVASNTARKVQETPRWPTASAQSRSAN